MAGSNRNGIPYDIHECTKPGFYTTSPGRPNGASANGRGILCPRHMPIAEEAGKLQHS